MKRLLPAAILSLVFTLNAESVLAQCGTTPISGDLIISSNTSLSGTYNITGLFRVEPGVVCSVTPYTSGGCGELIINAADIEVIGDIIGDGSGYPGGAGGGGAVGVAVEPPRVRRRLSGLSQAAMGIGSIKA